MSFFRDEQIRRFGFFLMLFSLLILGAGLLFSSNLVNTSKTMVLTHDEAVVTSLMEQGITKEVIAVALTNTEITEQGRNLLTAMGIVEHAPSSMLPFVSGFECVAILSALIIATLLVLILFTGTFFFYQQRKQLYAQAEKIINNYTSGDYSCHLPQNSEGEIFQVFAMVEQLATMLQSKSETEHKTKEFLKSTISDISHQLKTPLAALTLYQEIIENEPDNPETVREFSAKIGTALKRMEQLIQSMLKITRLDTGNIVFEKSRCNITELISLSINELVTRAESERKQILTDGSPEQQIVCDLEWTSEAVRNIIKNALDHTKADGIIRIAWEHTPAMVRLFISDNGDGIAPEDIYHIFKRFYRSKHSLDTQGIGLGLPLAKSIVEGQGGLISVQSEPGIGTTFALSFLTDL